MTRVKGNIAGVAQTGLAFVLNEQGVVEWDPEPIYVSANEVESDLKLDRSKLNAAIDLLQAELERGPRLATDIQTEANRHAVSKRTLHRAKGEIGVLAYQQGRKWWWALPGQVPEQSQPQEPAKVYRFDDGGNLLGESEVAP